MKGDNGDLGDDGDGESAVEVLRNIGESLGDGVKTGDFAMNDAVAPGILSFVGSISEA